jgi:hypothetical protein
MDTYKWLISNLLRFNDGVEPGVILTDFGCINVWSNRANLQEYHTSSLSMAYATKFEKAFLVSQKNP